MPFARRDLRETGCDLFHVPEAGHRRALYR
jgi:hypothetical protein